VQQDTEIFAVDAEFSAEFLAVGFVKKEALEDPAVFLGQLG